VPKDDAEALFWFRKAAAQHDPSAAYNLGAMYAEGRGGQRDLGEAVIFYREAGDRGNNAAQSNLGAMYAEGQGVPQNFLLAHMWLSLAAASANRIAIKNRDIVAGHMSPEQIAESERLARERQLQRSLPTSSPR
jgi:TPR repeat protein